MKSSSELRWKQQHASIAAANKAVSDRLRELDRRSPAKDAAEVVALREAVESLKATQQRFAGKFYKQLQLDGGDARDTYGNDPTATHNLRGPLNGLDPELAAELALQSAPPVSPGGK